MKTIAIANQKGGAGKTTTAYNLGIALTQQGYRVLMVDFDPQGNLSCYCGIPPEQDLEQTITELLMKVAYEKPLSHRECVYQSKRTDDSAPQVDFIPSNLRLASFELAMGTMMCREVLLKTCLEQYSSQYDYCIIDCSPSVGLLLTNALSAANEVIIPMQAQPFSVVGMSQLTNSISSVQRKINPGLHIRGVLLTMTQHTKVFNLKDRDKSDHYNLFAYIKNEDDILVVTKNLVKNLKEDPTAKSTADPIWEEGMTALLEALIGYVFYELEPEERNMNNVMTLLLMLESQGDGPNSVSQLDLLFDDLSINKPNSFAAKQYKLYKMAPGKTAQSINVSLGLRMSAFNIPSIANICADDTIDLRELGSEKKVALFVVTPDTTTAYNFLAAVMFQQCFQILVDIADHRPDKRLPRHLRFLLDEFPNIGMIPDFQILISTIRSRDIACTLIYQSLNQLKSQYKDDWATIYENCDSMIVLGAGGNPENLEFFSKALGKATIEVMNTSENKGSQGSYTKSYQALGRELMTPEEIRTMPRNWCLLMISGVAPFYSRKYNLKDHPNYHLVEAEGGKPFDYDRRAEQSFADFISNVKDVKTVNLCAENNN